MTPLLACISVGVVMFTVKFLICLRLAAIGELGVTSDKTGASSGWSKIEAGIYTILNIALIMLLAVGLARFIITPDYPGGPFAFDSAMGLAALIILLDAVVAIPLLNSNWQIQECGS